LECLFTNILNLLGPSSFAAHLAEEKRWSSGLHFDTAIEPPVRSRSLVWGLICQGGEQHELSYFIASFLVRLSSTRFLIPTRHKVYARGRRSGQGWPPLRLPPEGLGLDGFEHDGRIGALADHRPHLYRHHWHAGAFDAMWSGRVDRNWAKEHHSLWYRAVAQKAEASSARIRGSPVVAFASSMVAAILLALSMVAIYQFGSISSTELAASATPQSVHLQAEAETEKAK